MEHSTELRWFWPAGPDGVLSAVATQVTTLLDLTEQEPETRTDDYLRFPSVELGVKRRSGNLEIKHRLGARIAREERGAIEQWVKWSSPLPSAAELEGDWLSITKRRRTVQFAFEQGHLRRVEAAESPDCGCQVEWTELHLPGGPSALSFWTLGFEAYGDPAQQESWLRSASRTVSAALDLLPVAPASSGSYPDWLYRIAPSGRPRHLRT